MNRERVFQVLEKQTSTILLEVLQAAYGEMNTSQRQEVFGEFAAQRSSSLIDGKELLREVREFERESLAGVYYAPFDINSKNFMDVPEETEEWFDRLGDLLKDSSTLTEQGNHAQAVECFGMLYRLIETMENGEEIVFADEYGSWMIPCEGKEILAAYISSLSAIKIPEEFTAVVLPLIRRDSRASFVDRAYASANRVASKEQKAHLRAEIKRQKVETSSRSRRK